MVIYVEAHVFLYSLKEWTRVWLICELRVSHMLPSFIVDYAARRAMPRATAWLKPQVETASKLWLKNGRMPPSTTRREYRDGENGTANVNGKSTVNGEVKSNGE